NGLLRCSLCLDRLLVHVISCLFRCSCHTHPLLLPQWIWLICDTSLLHLIPSQPRLISAQSSPPILPNWRMRVLPLGLGSRPKRKPGSPTGGLATSTVLNGWRRPLART